MYKYSATSSRCQHLTVCYRISLRLGKISSSTREVPKWNTEERLAAELAEKLNTDENCYSCSFSNVELVLVTAVTLIDSWSRMMEAQPVCADSTEDRFCLFFWVLVLFSYNWNQICLLHSEWKSFDFCCVWISIKHSFKWKCRFLFKICSFKINIECLWSIVWTWMLNLKRKCVLFCFFLYFFKSQAF